jgi:2-amino-4-hydroxy-6-hydroxymethyldihydropteridine diphosphokinase
LTHTVYIALGTNLGQRLDNLQLAIAAFAPSIQVLAKSAVYETEPWGYADQPAFLNMALRAGTELSPAGVLAFLKDLEASLGRTPSFRNGPRLIDMDILFYDDLVLDTPALVVPHPRLHERSFVLVPLMDIAPGLLHPRLGLSVAQMTASLDKGGIKIFTG